MNAPQSFEKHLRGTKPSATLGIKPKVTKIAKSLGISMPTFLTAGQLTASLPKSQIRILSDFIKSALMLYTPTDGLPEVREKVAEHITALNRDTIPTTKENIILQNGAKPAITQLFSSFKPGTTGTMISFKPGWGSHDAIADKAGFDTISINTDPNVDWEGLDKALSELPKDKVNIFTLSAFNPTGGHILANGENFEETTQKVYQKLSKVLSKYPDVIVFEDALYASINFHHVDLKELEDKKLVKVKDEEVKILDRKGYLEHFNTSSEKELVEKVATPSLLSVAPELAPRFAYLSGISKSGKFTGGRAGSITIYNEKLYKQVSNANAQEQGNANLLGQVVYKNYFNKDSQFDVLGTQLDLALHRQILENSLESLKEKGVELELLPAKSAMYGYVHFPFKDTVYKGKSVVINGETLLEEGDKLDTTDKMLTFMTQHGVVGVPYAKDNALRLTHSGGGIKNAMKKVEKLFTALQDLRGGPKRQIEISNDNKATDALGNANDDIAKGDETNNGRDSGGVGNSINRSNERG